MPGPTKLAPFIGGPLDGQTLDVAKHGDRIVVPVPGPGGFGQVEYMRMPNRLAYVLVHDCALARGYACCGECFCSSFTSS